MHTKLGKNKGLERSRIWIEGTRLTDAGFHRGEYYLAEYEGDHPIIDITGKTVKEFFDGSEYVEVDYQKGVIVIRGVK